MRPSATNIRAIIQGTGADGDACGGAAVGIGADPQHFAGQVRVRAF
jgi:hypothetical protein